MNPAGIVSELVKSVKRTAEFTELVQAGEAVEKNQPLKKRMSEMDRLFVSFQEGNLSKKEYEGKVAEWNRMLQDLRGIPEADRYLKALKQFNDMMFWIYRAIYESIGAELKKR